MVRNLFNLITAWVSVVLLVLVIVIWLLRVLVQKKLIKKDSLLFNANKHLRKYHKWLGIAFLVIALIHGMLSSDEVLSFNWGSVSFLFIVIMGLSYLIKDEIDRRAWVSMHRFLTLLVAATFFIHLVDVEISGINLLKVPAADINNEIELTEKALADMQAIAEGNVVYSDGIYTGVADAYGPDLTVEVTIENSLITNVVVVSHNEVRERFWRTPVEEIPVAIVEAQSVDVDSISGATYTSVGIKNAVLDALNQAIAEGVLPEAESVESTSHQHGRGH